jgi:hypothetical protein
MVAVSTTVRGCSVWSRVAWERPRVRIFPLVLELLQFAGLVLRRISRVGTVQLEQADMVRAGAAHAHQRLLAQVLRMPQWWPGRRSQAHQCLVGVQDVGSVAGRSGLGRDEYVVGVGGIASRMMSSLTCGP